MNKKCLQSFDVKNIYFFFVILIIHEEVQKVQ